MSIGNIWREADPAGWGAACSRGRLTEYLTAAAVEADHNGHHRPTAVLMLVEAARVALAEGLTVQEAIQRAADWGQRLQIQSNRGETGDGPGEV